jgi:PAS domain S-box-containing protein
MNKNKTSSWRGIALNTLFPVGLTIILAFFTVYVISLPTLKTNMITAKKELIRELTITACELLADYQRRVEAGELTLEEAKARGRARISRLRYGPEKKDYFWINDMHPKMVMHPFRKELDGQDLSSYKDPKGKHLFVEFVKAVKEYGEGYVEYMWQWKDHPERVGPKLSYVQGFKPWNWIVGTGVYLEDLDEESAALTRNIHFAFGLILSFIVILLLLLVWQNRRREKKHMATEDALQASREQYKTLVETMNEGLSVADQDTVITYANPSFARMMGYSVGELVGHKIQEFLNEENLQILRAQRQLRQKGKQDNYEIEWIKKDGSKLSTILSPKPLFDENDNFIGSFAIITDITARKNAEEEMKFLQTQLLQTQKMESIGILAGGIAHDFNNLLTVINGHSYLAMRKLPGDHKALADIDAINKAGDKAVALTRQLLAFGRKQAFEPITLDIHFVIEDLNKMLCRLISEDILLETKLQEETPLLKADPAQLEQILINLVVNARDAVKEREKFGENFEKRITIETSSISLDETFTKHHPDSTPGRYVLIIVRDTGIGIKAEVKNKIFEPFFTTKGAGKGTGLGLSTIYGIVKQNNGFIDVNCKPGEFTEFRIYWPTAKLQIETDKLQTGNPRIVRGTGTILLAEDDPEVRIFTENALEELGYSVYSAPDGFKAITFVLKDKLKFDLLMTDLIMPKVNGVELARKIKNLIPEIKVLYCSGYQDEHLALKGQLKEKINFLQKPYSIYQLAQTVRSILDNT